MKKFLKSSNNQVTNNIMYSTFASPVKTLQIWASDDLDINTDFNHNTYGSPDEDNIYYIADEHWSYVTIEEFQQLSGMGQGAFRPQVEDYTKSLLVYNDTHFEKSYNLSDGSYFDIYGNELTELILEPFLSKIIIQEEATNENQPPVINNQVFDIEGDLTAGEFIGQVIATDPDQGQTLSYDILNGNMSKLFSLNAETGEIFINDDFYTDSDMTYILEIKVSDNAIESLSDKAIITVNLLQVTSTIFSDDNEYVKIYPNPVKNVFNIQLDINDLIKPSLHIYNSSGQKLYDKAANDGLVTIDTRYWGKGVYTIMIIDGNDRLIESKKIVIQ